MLYTEKEKHEIERVKEVFAEHLRQSPDFELLWSDKVGYVWLTIGVNPVHQDRISRRSLRQVFGRCCYGCFVYDGQRSCTGSSRPAGISRNQAALGAIYQPAARLCVSLQRPAERKNVIYQTRCQEPYGASGTFFVNLIKKSLTIRLWQDSQKHLDFLRCKTGSL